MMQLSSDQHQAHTPKAATDRVAGQLRDEIITGVVTPGTSLVESTLCTRYDVSRNTVRAAMQQLRAEGLVIAIRHRGMIVKTLAPADVRDIYRVRRTLELSAIERSSFAPEGAMHEVRRAVEYAEEARAQRQWNAVGTASLRFHQTVVALLGSKRLDDFFRTLVAQLRLTFALFHDEGEFQSRWVPKDREIYAFLASGQRKEAAYAMQVYLEASEASVLDIVHATQARTA